MQHQLITLRRDGDLTVIRYLTADGYRCTFQTMTREQAISTLSSAIDDDGSRLEPVNVLNIDAWRDIDGGWTWNNWRYCGRITRRELKALDTPRRLFAWLRRHGYLSAASAGAVAQEDDGYNLVIVDRVTREPLFAIEYGAGL